MKAAIEKILILERIRKEITRISELAEDIKKNGLLHPIIVMNLENGELRLLAGLRRVRAVQSLGWTEIEVNIISPADAEAALNIEISENEQREPFTYSEKMDYARLIEEIEKAKSNERQQEGRILGGMIAGRGRPKDDSLVFCGTPSYGDSKKKTRDLVGEKIGMSGAQYERAKFVADNASPKTIEQLDNGEKTITGVYTELHAKENSMIPADSNAPVQPEAVSEPQPQKPSEASGEKAASRSKVVSEEEQMKYLSKQDVEAIRKLREFDALPPEDKIIELQRQLKEMRIRAINAEADLAALKDRYGISFDHKDSIIESLKRQNTDLDNALTAAYARIAELEGSTNN